MKKGAPAPGYPLRKKVAGPSIYTNPLRSRSKPILLLQKLDQELTQHLAKEEMVLFPYIVNSGTFTGRAAVRNPGAALGPFPPTRFRMMTQEHDGAG